MKVTLVLLVLFAAGVFLRYDRDGQVKAGEQAAQVLLQTINAAEQAYITHYPDAGYTL